MNIAMISSWHVHARGYANDFAAMPECQITAVWDEDEKAGKAWAAELGCPFVADYQAILQDPAIDGIVMTAPTSMHGEMLLQAAVAGKHIFTEKVLAITTEEALAIAEAVREAGVQFVISFPHKCRADLNFAKSMAASGELGQITYARIRNVHNGSSANWLPDHFYDEEQCGGGAMMDLGAHPMYLLNWILGQPKSVVSAFTKVTGRAVEDNAVSVLEYENGAIGVSETGFVAQDNPFTMEICGTKGTLLVRDGVSYASAKTDHKWIRVETLPDAPESPQRQWVDAVTKGTPVTVGIDEAVALTVVMEGAYRAYKTEQRYSF